jgi:hypothetical protein
MPYAMPHWVWDAVVLLVCAAAAWRGGRDERVAAAALLVGVVLSKAVYAHHAQQVEWGVLAVDSALLATLVWIALISDRFWPIAAAAFQFLAVIVHLARVADPSLGGWAYFSAEILFGYLLAGAIAVGTFNARRKNSAPAADSLGGSGPTYR